MDQDQMDVGQQLLELQVKEKCGNRVVKVILDRIQVSGSVHNPKKYQENCSSPKINLQNQDRSLRDVGRPSTESAPNIGRSRPQRNKTKTYTQYFDEGNDSGDDEYIESDASCSDSSDSEPSDTLDCEFKSSPLNKAKRKKKNSKKTHTNLDPGNTAEELEIGKTEPKIACSVCNKHILSRHMKRHFKVTHPHKKLPTLKRKETTIPCVFCSASVTHRYRWGHLQKKHPEQLVKGDLDEPRKVKCDLCPSVFLLEELYKHKKTSHPHNEKVKVENISCLQCDWCSGKYKTRFSLENHILKFHVVDKPFECDICFQSYLTEELLHQHVKRVHEAKKFSCRSCPNKTFADSASLKIHIETHHRSYSGHSESESTGNNHMCPVCDTCFVTESDLVKHLQKPGLKSVMKCKLCSKPVHTPCRLNVHLQKMHSATPKAQPPIKREHLIDAIVESTPAMDQSYSIEETKTSASITNQVSPRKFSCVVCSADFSRRCDLDLHELHEKHRRWKCPICAKLVGTKPDLKTHVQAIHSDARPFHCTHKGCCKSFKVREVLKKHEVLHDPDRVRCKECFKYFTKKEFPLHVANKHRADQAFKCDFCDKTWGALKRLKQHLLTHTDKRPFPCKFCSARYKCSAVAKQHMKKCQVRSEDERKKGAKRSHMVVQQAKTRKPGRWRKLTDETVKLSETRTPKETSPSRSELTCASTSFTKNGASLKLINHESGLKLIKEEVDLNYSVDNSSDFEHPSELAVSAPKLEMVPKQEMCTYSD